MKIKVRPSDLITRFVWDRYEHFCLDGKNSTEIAALIAEDAEFEISETDAFVINLTNVIYTPEVVYKFKQHLKETLENKSFEQDKKRYINREILIDCCLDFRRKIPRNWKSEDLEFNLNLAALPPMYDQFQRLINALTAINVQECMCVRSSAVKKIINKL
jgi:hypothetical protein